MSLPSRVAKISKLLAPKGAIYGQGFCQKCQPNGQKGAISEKEIAIFELRKVLFPDKHLRELPGAYPTAPRAPSFDVMTMNKKSPDQAQRPP